MSMALLLLRLAMGEILKSSDRKSSNKGDIFQQLKKQNPQLFSKTHKAKLEDLKKYIFTFIDLKNL